MNIQTNTQMQRIKHLCTTGLFWNAFMYSIEKIAYWIIQVILFARLSTTHFSLWANLLAIVYLIVLWADFGLRASIPRYAPLMVKHKELFNSLMSLIVSWYALSTLCIATILAICFGPILNFLSLTTDTHIISLAILLFIAESILSVTKTISHSFFKHRTFNLIHSLCTFIELGINSFLIISSPPDLSLVKKLLISRITMASTISILAFLFIGKRFHKNIATQTNTNLELNHKLLQKEFIIHSAHMWGQIAIQSLSERNVILPLLTLFFGPALANIYKVINSSIALFQRAITKTIDTIDISFLTLSIFQINNNKNPENTSNADALKRIISMIKTYITFTLPIASLASITFAYNSTSLIKLTDIHPYAFLIFLTIATSRFIEIILSPYRRYLEVSKKYKLLWIGTIPHIGIYLFTIIFFSYNYHQNISIYTNNSMHLYFIFILAIHSSQILTNIFESLLAHNSLIYKPTSPYTFTTIPNILDPFTTNSPSPHIYYDVININNEKHSTENINQ